jgi:hypothetical protein
MNAIVFWTVAGCLYAANTGHLLWLPLVWICFPGILLAHGIAMLFDRQRKRWAAEKVGSGKGGQEPFLSSSGEFRATVISLSVL